MFFISCLYMVLIDYEGYSVIVYEICDLLFMFAIQPTMATKNTQSVPRPHIT